MKFRKTIACLSLIAMVSTTYAVDWKLNDALSRTKTSVKGATDSATRAAADTPQNAPRPQNQAVQVASPDAPKSTAVDSGCIKLSTVSDGELDIFVKRNGKGYIANDMRLTNKCDHDVVVLLHAVDTLMMGLSSTPGDERFCQASALEPGRYLDFRSKLPQRHAAVSAQAAKYSPMVCHGTAAGNDMCGCAPGVRQQMF